MGVYLENSIDCLITSCRPFGYRRPPRLLNVKNLTENSGDLRLFASTLKKISPKAFDFVRSSLAGDELQPDPEAKAGREKRPKANKKFKPKQKSFRKVDDFDQVGLHLSFQLIFQPFCF